MLALIENVLMRFSSYAWLSTAGGLSFMEWHEGRDLYSVLLLVLAYHYETMKPGDSL